MGRKEVSLSKYTRNGWGKFSRFTKYEVGDGTQIKFWHDARWWCCDELFRIAQVSFSCRSYAISQWFTSLGLNFMLTVQDWELESISSFSILLYSALVKGHGEDRICWTSSL